MGRTILAYRKVFDGPEFEVGLRFDCGHWTVESRSKRGGRVETASFTPEHMDRIVAGWPQMKKDVGTV